MELEFPRKLRFLFESHPNKILYGGRDGIKSWSVATALVELASNLGYWKDLGRKNLRVMCARETKTSIEASSHQLLADMVTRLNLTDRFLIQEQKITCTANGSEFFFVGLRHNPDAIKSAEGVDIVWEEEANQISKTSNDLLIPTIRKPGAEVWATFNPRYETDDAWRRWILNPPPGTIAVETSYMDNRWLSERSRVAIEHMKATNPDEFEHIYGGKLVSMVRGAIFGTEMKLALAEGRICQVPYNKNRPVDTVWDLGFNDPTSIWFVQAYDGFLNFIDFHESRGLTTADYVLMLQSKGYVYGTDWLPHDGIDTIIHGRLNGTGDRSKSIEMLMREAGRKPRIVPKLLVTDQINAARLDFNRCRFDSEKCAEGLNSLRYFQWGEPNEKLSTPDKPIWGKREPLHDWASHASSAFMGATIAMKQPQAEAPPRPPMQPMRPHGYSPFG
jgi:phage terminase large subunit